MPDPYPDHRFIFSRRSRTAAQNEGINPNDLIAVVKSYEFSRPGHRHGQVWYTGKTPGGTTLQVLVEEREPATVFIIDFH